MTPTDPTREKRRAPEARPDLCLPYLLGELDRDSRVAFEGQLATDPELGEALLEKADLILGLSSISSVEPRSERQDGMPTSRRSRAPSWRWIAAAASIAACVALAFQVTRLAPPQNGSTASIHDPPGVSTSNSNEELLIAMAWASSHDPIETIVNEFADPHADDALEIVSDDRSSSIDSAVSWMFVAISSSLEMQNDGGNDG